MRAQGDQGTYFTGQRVLERGRPCKEPQMSAEGPPEFRSAYLREETTRGWRQGLVSHSAGHIASGSQAGHFIIRGALVKVLRKIWPEQQKLISQKQG